MLEVKALEKIYRRGRLSRTPSFRLTADFVVGAPGIVGMMGPNGSG
jgi:hypothetical protein